MKSFIKFPISWIRTIGVFFFLYPLILIFLVSKLGFGNLWSLVSTICSALLFGSSAILIAKSLERGRLSDFNVAIMYLGVFILILLNSLFSLLQDFGSNDMFVGIFNIVAFIISIKALVRLLRRKKDMNLTGSAFEFSLPIVLLLLAVVFDIIAILLSR